MNSVIRHPSSVICLGIETSCDETAVAIVGSDKKIHANLVRSQMEAHAPYGGVVPEIAARAHIEHLPPMIEAALAQAKMTLAEVDAIAVTAGPGLIGGVIVGVMTAKAMASAANKPLIAVNHLEGHALTARLTHDAPFPFLLLLVSGGHCQFLIAHDVGRYEKLGGTVDDALGEAFDKVAKMLGLPMPGGPNVEKLAREGNPRAFSFSIPMKGREGCNLSFSGLKTAVREEVGKGQRTNDSNVIRHSSFVNDICASFQCTATASLIDRARNAIVMFHQRCPGGKTMVVAGGVAANQYIRGELEKLCAQTGLSLVAPPINLCTDNAAMIAWAGVERFSRGMVDDLSVEPKARWGLSAE